MSSKRDMNPLLTRSYRRDVAMQIAATLYETALDGLRERDYWQLGPDDWEVIVDMVRELGPRYPDKNSYVEAWTVLTENE